MEFGCRQTCSGLVHTTSVGEVHGAQWVIMGMNATRGLHLTETRVASWGTHHSTRGVSQDLSNQSCLVEKCERDCRQCRCWRAVLMDSDGNGMWVQTNTQWTCARNFHRESPWHIIGHGRNRCDQGFAFDMNICGIVGDTCDLPLRPVHSLKTRHTCACLPTCVCWVALREGSTP